jgi:hypothetical protein
MKLFFFEIISHRYTHISQQEDIILWKDVAILLSRKLQLPEYSTRHITSVWCVTDIINEGK